MSLHGALHFLDAKINLTVGLSSEALHSSTSARQDQATYERMVATSIGSSLRANFRNSAGLLPLLFSFRPFSAGHASIARQNRHVDEARSPLPTFSSSMPAFLSSFPRIPFNYLVPNPPPRPYNHGHDNRIGHKIRYPRNFAPLPFVPDPILQDSLLFYSAARLSLFFSVINAFIPILPRQTSTFSAIWGTPLPLHVLSLQITRN